MRYLENSGILGLGCLLNLATDLAHKKAFEEAKFLQKLFQY